MSHLGFFSVRRSDANTSQIEKGLGHADLISGVHVGLFLGGAKFALGIEK